MTVALRRYRVEWHQVYDHTTTVEAVNVSEARKVFRERTRHLGFGVTIQRIVLDR